MNFNQFTSVGYLLPALEVNEQMKMRTRIKSILDELFPNQYEEKIYGNNNELEAIYFITLPLFDTELQKIKTFRELKILFDDTSDLQPYFCNIKEVNNG